MLVHIILCISSSSTLCQCDLLETTQNEFPFFVKIKHPIVFGKQALIFGKHLPLFRHLILHLERAERAEKKRGKYLFAKYLPRIPQIFSFL